MTKKTTAQRDAEADAFVDHVTSNLPDSMQTHHILRLMGMTLTSYCDNGVDAGRTLLELALLVNGYYQQFDNDPEDGECMCDKCIAQRKAQAH